MRKMNMEGQKRHKETGKRGEKAALAGEFEGGAAGGTSDVV